MLADDIIRVSVTSPLYAGQPISTYETEIDIADPDPQLHFRSIPCLISTGDPITSLAASEARALGLIDDRFDLYAQPAPWLGGNACGGVIKIFYSFSGLRYYFPTKCFVVKDYSYYPCRLAMHDIQSIFYVVSTPQSLLLEPKHLQYGGQPYRGLSRPRQ